MLTEKDSQFIQFILEQTQQGKIHWESTADPAQFVVSFKGKYKVTIDEGEDEHDGEPFYFLTLFDDAERKLLVIYDGEASAVKEIYNLAERNALNVDSVIDDIMKNDNPGPSTSGPISDEDIPF